MILSMTTNTSTAAEEMLNNNEKVLIPIIWGWQHETKKCQLPKQENLLSGLLVV